MHQRFHFSPSYFCSYFPYHTFNLLINQETFSLKNLTMHPQLSLPTFGSLLMSILLIPSLTSACTKPTTKPTIDNSRPFGIQINSKQYPAIHNKNMNLWAAGGGDQHLYLSPAGAAAFNFQLNDGSITQNQIRTVINGEVRPSPFSWNSIFASTSTILK